jgi:hypothetical protein
VAAAMRQYIPLKQVLGRSFESQSIILLKLDRFLCQSGSPSPDLTEETFRLWCQTMNAVSSTVRRARMRIVRNFCLYRRRTVSDCFVPDPTQFPKPHPAVQPYIFSQAEVACLLSHSGCIPGSARSSLRWAATRLAIVLLYTAGLRRGELK